MDMRKTNNASQAVPSAVFSADAVSLGSSEITEDSGTITVIPGEDYLFLFDSDVLLGFADPTTAANIVWIVPAGKPVTVRIPFGKGTDLYYLKVA